MNVPLVRKENISNFGITLYFWIDLWIEIWKKSFDFFIIVTVVIKKYHNNFKCFPTMLSRLPNLRALDISNNDILSVPLDFLEKNNLWSFKCKNTPFFQLIIQDYQKPRDWISEYVKDLKAWSPNLLITRIRYNGKLLCVDLTHPELGKWIIFVLNKCMNVKNSTKLQFVEWVHRRFSVQLQSNSNLSIQL